MFAKYFASELAFLRERGPELAAGPFQATMRQLLARGGDPDIERLIESFALLAARIRERLDEDPPVIEALAELVAPHLLRALPATAIVEFMPNIHALRGVQTVARGRAMEGRTAAGDVCRFRTCYDVELAPIEVGDVALDARSPGRPELVIRLRVAEAGRASLTSPRALRFFIAGEPATALALRCWALQRCTGVAVQVRGPDGAALASSEHAASIVRSVGLDPEDALIPWPELSPPGLSLFHELLGAPEKAMFFALQGPLCDEVRGESVEIRLRFATAEALPGELGPGSLRLHCTPVVNLFESSAEPIRADVLRPEALVQASGCAPGQAEVYAVRGVSGSRGGRPTEAPLRPLYSDALAAPGDGRHYAVRRLRSPLDGGVDTYLVLGPGTEDGEVIHADLLCTNRHLAGSLGIGAIAREPRSGSLRFRNITAVTPAVPPPLGGDLAWRLLAHLSLGHAALADAGNLRRLLSAHDALAGTPRSAAARIAAIRRVSASVVTRRCDGAALRGLRTAIEVDAAGFLGAGDAHLFLSAIERIFVDRLGLNTFHELVARLVPAEIDLTWPARTGAMAPI